MATVINILSYIGKAAGIVSSLNAIPFVSPHVGVIIFFIASLLKDTVSRISDFLGSNSTPATTPASPSVAAATPAPVPTK